MIVDDLFGLKDKVALVTGAGQGLGQGYALNLARSGCVCACAGPSVDRLADTLDMINAEGGRAFALPMDVAKPESIENALAELIRRQGRVDILVNNAGVEIAEAFLDVTPEHYDTIMAVNHKGTFFAAQAVAKYMKEQRRGKIINIASLGSFIGLAESSVYCSSKGAVAQFTKAAAIELAPFNIQVNAIAPGYFLTRMTRPFFEDKTHREWIENRIPLGRVGMADDLAGPLIFLAGKGSDYVTGQIVIVDGGWLAS